MVIFDTSILVLSLDPENAKPPVDPSTGAPLTNCKVRIDHLIETLSAAGASILVPTPVLSEYLIKAGPNKDEYANMILQSKNFTTGDFNVRAAIELTLLKDPDLSKKSLDEKVTKAKIRFDRQIISIAKVNGADCVYTSDGNLAKTARVNGLRAVMAWELPEPLPETPDLFNQTDSQEEA